MIPKNDGLINQFEEVSEANKTYRVDLEKGRIVSKADGVEALKQAIFFMLSIERYDHVIYSWNYGVELMDLIGKDMAYVQSEVQRRISEVLVQDDRIESVGSFSFERNKNKLLVNFKVNSIYGQVDAAKEVSY